MSETTGGRVVILQRSIYHRWKFVLLWLGAIPCIAFLLIRDPADSSLIPPCPFLALTGFHCPGCGTLRALHQLLNGHLTAAFGLNPLTILALPFVGYAFLSTLVLAATGRRLPAMVIPVAWIWALLGAIILFWVLRNIPIYPFSLLAP